MTTHHLITGVLYGVPVLACAQAWEPGVTSGEPAGSSRRMSPLTCEDCASRCPHCAAPPGELHHRACVHPSSAGSRAPGPEPHGPVFSWSASGSPAQVLAVVEDLPEDNPLAVAVAGLLVRAMGRWHRDGDTYEVDASGQAGGGRPLTLVLHITPG